MPIKLINLVTAPLHREAQGFWWQNELLVIALECSVRDERETEKPRLSVLTAGQNPVPQSAVFTLPEPEKYLTFHTTDFTIEGSTAIKNHHDERRVWDKVQFISDLSILKSVSG